MRDTQMTSVSPPHDKSTTTETIIIKYVSHASTQNINPLTIDDLKKILDQSILQAKWCGNPILDSVEELQKVVIEVTRDKVNTQEPPYVIPLFISDQNSIQTIVDTS